MGVYRCLQNEQVRIAIRMLNSTALIISTLSLQDRQCWTLFILFTVRQSTNLGLSSQSAYVVSDVQLASSVGTQLNGTAVVRGTCRARSDATNYHTTQRVIVHLVFIDAKLQPFSLHYLVHRLSNFYWQKTTQCVDYTYESQTQNFIHHAVFFVKS